LAENPRLLGRLQFGVHFAIAAACNGTTLSTGLTILSICAASLIGVLFGDCYFPHQKDCGFGDSVLT
jgi:hypothetical protein